MTRVALVGCSSQKLERAAPARELYTSQLFRRQLEHAEAQFEHVRILSALHGVVRLDQVLEPYDHRMPGDGESRAEWAHRVMVWQLAPEFGDHRAVELVVYAGRDYVEPLRWQLADFPRWSVEAPLSGLQVGRRLSWLKLQKWRPA